LAVASNSAVLPPTGNTKVRSSAADDCPGNCIHAVRRDDGVEVAGPDGQ
jgi:hypothetical protein